MECLDVRRLTGPNLLWNRSCSILDVGCTDEEAESLIPAWESAVGQMLDTLGWSGHTTIHRKLSGGISLAVSAPIDALYAATTINEWAWQVCNAGFGDDEAADFETAVEQVRESVSEEANPELLALQNAARDHGATFLWDDDDVSTGLGTGSQSWPARELPDPGSLDWSRYHDVPAGLVTGTNGKTTTARLLHHILQTAGRNVGISSTEWIAVNDRIIDRGDWSGPGGARQVLRQRDVDVAVLETARGGLLRRGLGLCRATAAVITNISEDHLGDFGSQNLQELLDIKWLVSRTVEVGGTLILNADDKLLVAKSSEFPGRLVWFGMDIHNPVIVRHINEGGTCYVLDHDLVRVTSSDRQVICSVDEIPITIGGAARHNIANALAAAAMAEQLDVRLSGIRKGLCSMALEDNPGRSNIYLVNGVNVVIDFAHNPAAIQALLDMARALPGKRRLLAFGQAGDRPDDLIRELARKAWEIDLDAVIISELAMYYRGREPGEVYAIIKDELMRCGAREQQISHYDEELDTLQAALDWAEPGDLVIMLALGGSTPVREMLASIMQE